MSKQIKHTIILGKISCGWTPINVDITLSHIATNDELLLKEIRIVKKVLSGQLTAFYKNYGVIWGHSFISVKNHPKHGGRSYKHRKKN